MDVVVAYDVADTQTPEGARRLRRVADVCTQYGTRQQLSLFECRLSPERLVRLMDELRDVIEPDDRVVIYRITGDLRSARTQLGRGDTRALGDPWLL